MTVRSRSFLAAAAGLLLAAPLLGQEPARLGVEPGPALTPSANQKLANTVADHLRQSGQLRRYSIDVAVHDGTAEVSGMVADQPQREEALRIVQGVPGVEQVRDRLTLESSGVVQVQDRPRPLPPPTRIEPQPWGAVIIAPGAQEPMPIFQAPAAGAYDVNPPKMPPYAWPTYARRLPRSLPVSSLAVHRAGLPIPESAARLALGQAPIRRRALVVQPNSDQVRLVAGAVLVTGRDAERRDQRSESRNAIRLSDL